MMFTDEDLKRLKDDVAKGGWSPKMPALIHRLECAEKALLSRTLIEEERCWDAWFASKGAARE